MRKMILIIFIILVLVLGIAAGFEWFLFKGNPMPFGRQVLIGSGYKKTEVVFKTENGEVKFLAEVADTAGKKIRGLSGREDLGEKEGMLFVYDKPVRSGFWMKGMKFPIDIIWIKEGKVIGVTENMTPESFWRGKIFYPPDTADRVLEIKAGEVERSGIRVGDGVEGLK